MPDDEEYLWPEPGGSFFFSERTRDDAYTWFHKSLDEYAYVYRLSAEHLLGVAGDAPGLLNTFALPSVYLFRHFVELKLKATLVTARQLNDQDPAFPDGHSLLSLWIELRSLVESAGLLSGDDDESLFDTVGQMITELHNNDPGSMSFRYPVGKSSRDRPELLPDRFEYIDMRVFAEQAQRLSHFLDACADHLGAALENKREFEEWLE